MAVGRAPYEYRDLLFPRAIAGSPDSRRDVLPRSGFPWFTVRPVISSPRSVCQVRRGSRLKHSRAWTLAKYIPSRGVALAGWRVGGMQQRIRSFATNFWVLDGHPSAQRTARRKGAVPLCAVWCPFPSASVQVHSACRSTTGLAALRHCKKVPLTGLLDTSFSVPPLLRRQNGRPSNRTGRIATTL